MPVPNTFANATTAIPLSQLDNNFATAITMGNTAVQLGNTITTMNNMTFPNVTISSVATTFPNSYLANSSATLGNTTITLGSTTSTVGNLTLTNPALGTPASGNLTNCTADGTSAVGFRNIPQSGSDKTTSYSLATTDVGEFVGVGTGGSITIPNSTFAAGDVISLFNNTTGNITITCSITTAYIAGTNTDKDTMTLATRGVATILFISGTVCVVTGNVS
jgi:hypothetical protein